MEGEIPLFYMNSTEFIPFTVININPTAEYGIGEVTGVYLFVKKCTAKICAFQCLYSSQKDRLIIIMMMITIIIIIE